MTNTVCDVDGCDRPVVFRGYATYNADHGENVHPLHARYPMPMFRTCGQHLATRMATDAETPGSSRQWLIVLPNGGSQK